MNPFLKWMVCPACNGYYINENGVIVQVVGVSGGVGKIIFYKVKFIKNPGDKRISHIEVEYFNKFFKKVDVPDRCRRDEMNVLRYQIPDTSRYLQAGHVFDGCD